MIRARFLCATKPRAAETSRSAATASGSRTLRSVSPRARTATEPARTGEDTRTTFEPLRVAASGRSESVLRSRALLRRREAAGAACISPPARVVALRATRAVASGDACSTAPRRACVPDSLVALVASTAAGCVVALTAADSTGSADTIDSSAVGAASTATPLAAGCATTVSVTAPASDTTAALASAAG